MTSLLPLGTVVSLKKQEEKLIIIGTNFKKDDKKYDYIGIPYPNGFILDMEYEKYFNEDDIEKMYFLGNTNYQGK